MTSQSSNNSLASFTDAIKEVKELDPKIFAVFVGDTDGMPVHEVGLFDLFSRDGGFALCSFAAEILGALRSVEGEDLTISPFDTFLAENEDYNMQLFYLTEGLILGIISSRDANIGLIRMVVSDLIPVIRGSLEEMFR